MKSVVKHQDYQFVGLLKFFFCLCVVAIHSSIIPVWPWASAIARLAVPFSFVASGFFLGKKTLIAEKNEIWEIIKHYCLRLLKLFIVFSVIIITENCITMLVGGSTILDALQIQVWYLLVYPRGALWYLSACMVGALLLVPFLRTKKLNLALFLGSRLYGFALLCNNYYFLIENTRLELYIQKYLNYFSSARNGLFVGFFFLAIGIKCAQIFFGRLDKMRQCWIYPLFGVAFCLYLAEAYLISRLAKDVFREDGAHFIS